jgi:N-acetyltransferase
MMRLAHAAGEVAGVSLAPLEAGDSDALRQCAQDPAIWTWWPRDMLSAPWEKVFGAMLADQAAGTMLHHTVRLDGGIVGTTAYLNIRPLEAVVEIGFTWYVAAARKTAVNPAAKLMLLGHGFASGARRIELKTDALNVPSRGAMLKMGAQFEGIHRSHMPLPSGRRRDTAWYSVLPEEWPGVEAGLKARLGL